MPSWVSLEDYTYIICVDVDCFFRPALITCQVSDLKLKLNVQNEIYITV